MACIPTPAPAGALPGYQENTWGDMAYAVRSGRPHRASGELAYHVLEAMLAFHGSSDEQRFYPMQSTCLCPAALLENLRLYTLDA